MSIEANDTYVEEWVMSLTETYPLFTCHLKFKRSVVVTMHFVLNFYHRLTEMIRNICYSTVTANEGIIAPSAVVKQPFDKVKCLYVPCSRSLGNLRQKRDWIRTEQR